MSGSSVGYRPSSGYRRSDLVRGLGSSGGDGGGFTPSGHRDGGGGGGGGYVSSGGGYRPSSSSSARYGGSSMDYGSMSSSSASSYSPRGVSSGYGSDSSYGSGMSGRMAMSRSSGGGGGGGGAGIYANSPYDDPNYQNAQMMRTGQRGMHTLPSGGAVGRDRGDDGLFPTPRLPSAPMMSGGGERKRGRNSADIIGAVTQLSQMGNPESKLALNILNSVLGGSEEEEMSGFGGSPPSKMMRMDMDEGHGIRRGPIHSPSVPVYNPLQRDYQYQPPLIPSLLDQVQQSRSSYSHDSYDPAGHQMMATDSYRRPVMSRLGRPQPDTRNYRDHDNYHQKGRTGSSGAARRGKTSDGQRASLGPRQRDARGNQAPGMRGDKFPAKHRQEEFPVDALKCYMCKVDKYHSVNEYLSHLNKKEHMLSSSAYHLHGNEVFNLLKINAKLISERQLAEAQIGTSAEPVSARCNRCQCRVVGIMDAHTNSCEHIVMDRFLNFRCCQRHFTNRVQLEEHRLSLEHLKNDYKKMKKQSKDKETASKEEEEKKPATKEDDKKPAIKEEEKEAAGKEEKKPATKEEEEEKETKEENNEEEEKEADDKEEENKPAIEEEEMEKGEEDTKPAVREEKMETESKDEDKPASKEEEEKKTAASKEEEEKESESKDPASKEQDKEMKTGEAEADDDDDDDEVSEEEAMRMFKDAAEQHQANGGKEVFKSTNVPPYDPKNPMGLHCLAVFSDYRCEVCPDTKLRMNTSTVMAHYQSIMHYMNIFPLASSFGSKKTSEEEEWENEDWEEEEKVEDDAEAEGQSAAESAKPGHEESGEKNGTDATSKAAEEDMETEEVKEGERVKRQTPQKDLSKVKKEEPKKSPSKVKKESQTEEDVEAKKVSRTVQKPNQDPSKVTKQEPRRQLRSVKKAAAARKEELEEKPFASVESKGQKGKKKTNAGKETTEEVQEAGGDVGEETAGDSGTQQQEKEEEENEQGDGEGLLEEELLKEGEEDDEQEVGEELLEEELLGNYNEEDFEQEGDDAFDVDINEAADLINE